MSDSFFLKDFLKNKLHAVNEKFKTNCKEPIQLMPIYVTYKQRTKGSSRPLYSMIVKLKTDESYGEFVSFIM